LFLYCSNCPTGYSFLPADKTKSLCCCGLKADCADRNIQYSSNEGTDLLNIRRQPRLLGSNHQINLHYPETFTGQKPLCDLQQCQTVGPSQRGSEEGNNGRYRAGCRSQAGIDQAWSRTSPSECPFNPVSSGILIPPK